MYISSFDLSKLFKENLEMAQNLFYFYCEMPCSVIICCPSEVFQVVDYMSYYNISITDLEFDFGLD